MHTAMPACVFCALICAIEVNSFKNVMTRASSTFVPAFPTRLSRHQREPKVKKRLKTYTKLASHTITFPSLVVLPNGTTAHVNSDLISSYALETGLFHSATVMDGREEDDSVEVDLSGVFFHGEPGLRSQCWNETLITLGYGEGEGDAMFSEVDEVGRGEERSERRKYG